MDAIEIGIGVLGGLALFLFGMHTLSEGLKAAAGGGMKTLLARLTTNRFTATVTGALVTAVIQSSSVTTVLVVGFISAGLMSLPQSVGVIMGANIGSTATAQIVAFKVTKYAWAMVAAGFAFRTFSRKEIVQHYGVMILGLGMLFLGLDQMSAATNPLRTFQPFIEFMARLDNPFLGIVVGAGFTVLVQSSAATTGIVIMLASQGFLSLEAGIAVAIGANIGTCFTAVLSAFGKPPEAVRAAVVHVLFNVIGALMWIGFISFLADVAREFSPLHPELSGPARLAAETPRQIANANTLFNVANTLILIWFAGPIAHLAMKIVPDRPTSGPKPVEPRYLDKVYLGTPPIGIDRVRMELGHMGGCVVRMLDAAPDAWNSGDRRQLIRIANQDDDVDRLHTAILDYIRALSSGELKATDAARLEDLFIIANYLESIGDLVATDLVAQGINRLERHVELHRGVEIGNDYWDAVAAALKDVMSALATNDADLARDVVHRKAGIYEMANDMVHELGIQLRNDAIDLDRFRISADVVGQIKRIYYNIRKIAQIIVKQAVEGEAGGGSAVDDLRPSPSSEVTN